MARDSAGGSGLEGASDQPDEPGFHRDRREHGGAPQHLDDDRLAREAREERAAAGLDD